MFSGDPGWVVLTVCTSRHSPVEKHSAYMSTSLQVWTWDLFGHAPRRQGGRLRGFHVRSQFKASDLQGCALLVRSAKGPATLLYEGHIVQRVRWYHLCYCQALKPFPGARPTSKERIVLFPLIRSGGAWAYSSVTVSYMCRFLGEFECRQSFTVRCWHSSGGRMQTWCVVSLFLGHMASAPAPRITQHSLAFESNKSAGSQSQGRGHQDVTRSPRMLEAMWQKYTVEKRRAFLLPLPTWY